MVHFLQRIEAQIIELDKFNLCRVTPHFRSRSKVVSTTEGTDQHWLLWLSEAKLLLIVSPKQICMPKYVYDTSKRSIYAKKNAYLPFGPVLLQGTPYDGY